MFLHSDTMSSWSLISSSVLLCFLVTLVVGEPSCENVEDFGGCTGDTGDFCPGDIACSCKSGRPFCSCPFFRGPNGNYWYLGEKCNQLWSTLDMIVLAVFPAVALAFVVAVTAQLIHLCKTKPKSHTVQVTAEPRKKSERKTMETHQNEAFVPDEAPRNHYVGLPLADVRDQGQNLQTMHQDKPAARAPKPHGLNYYSDVPPVSRSSNERRQQPQYFGHEPDFKGYEMQREQQQNPRFSGFSIPPADYEEQAPVRSSAGPTWEQRPFRIERPQVRNNYDY